MDTTFIQAKDFIQIYETIVWKNGTFSNVDSNQLTQNADYR